MPEPIVTGPNAARIANHYDPEPKQAEVWHWKLRHNWAWPTLFVVLLAALLLWLTVYPR